MRFASRMNNLRASAIREFFDQGRRIPDAINLAIGQMPFDVPQPIKQATIDTIKGHCGRYSPTEGYPEVVAATKRHLVKDFSLDEGETVMMTAGATGALTLAFLALAGPGDEVLLPDPFFVVYGNLAHIVGATPTFYNMYPDFRPDADEIAAKITPRTRLLVFNNPANPTGSVYTPEEVKAVADVCAKHGVPVVSDELHAKFVYDGEHTSIKRYLGAGSILVGGLSKTYAMAGWRLGWAAGAPDVIDKLRVLQQFTYTCPPTLVQRGVEVAFGVDISEHVEEHRRKRDLVYDALVSAGYLVTKPQGSIFLFARVPEGDDISFCERALKEKLLIVPGRAFSRRNTHFRVCFAPPEATLVRGLEVLTRLVS